MPNGRNRLTITPLEPDQPQNSTADFVIAVILIAITAAIVVAIIWALI